MEQRTVLGHVTNAHNNKNKRKSLLPGFKPGNGKMQSTSHPKASRMSLGPGLSSRTSLGGAKSSRNSVAPETKNRRKSSVGASYKNKRKSVMGNVMKLNDPRPISNKGFMQAGIRNLIEFLTQHNYDYPISPKVLSRPTGKDFQNILQFLFLLLDRNLRFSQKFTEEVPMIFKGLQYPFSISKTSLSAVGSMHTWPPLLASLVWLMELLECHETAMDREVSEEEENGDKLFFVYLRKAYESFLCGDDDKYEELDRELVMNFEERDKLIETQVEEEKSRGQELLKELDRRKNDESSLGALQGKKSDFECDKKKFKQLISKLKDHKENLEGKNREREAEVNARQEEFNEVVRTRDLYQRKLDEQEISAADAERMNAEKVRLNEEQELVAHDKEKMERKILELEMAIDKRLEGLSGTVNRYNDIAKNLKLVPKSAQNSQGVDFDIKLNIAGLTRGESLLNVDVSKKLQPKLMELKDFAVRKTTEAKTQCLELQDQVDQNSEAKSKMENELLAADQAFKQLEKETSRKKEIMERELDSILSVKDSIAREAAKIRHVESSALSVEAEKQALVDAEEVLMKERLLFDKQEAEMETQMHSFLDMILVHKQQVEEVIGAVLTGHRERLNEVEQLCESTVEELKALIAE